MSLISIDDGTGVERKLACLSRTSEPGSCLFAPHYTEKFAVIERSLWRPMTISQAKEYVDGSTLPVLDQGTTSGCAGFAATGAVHDARENTGLDFVHLAAGRLYHISGGGGDRGSMLGDNLETAMKLGIPPMTSRDQELDWRSDWSEKETEEALAYRVVRAIDCPSFDYLVSASERGIAVEYGIFVGRNFSTDSSGIWMNGPSGDRGGHALFAPRNALVKNDEGEFGLLTKNSWGSKWGYKGWCIVPEAYFERSVFSDGWGVLASLIQ